MTAVQTQTIARGPGPRAWAMMIRTEGKSVARDTAGVLLPLVLPLLVLVTSATMAGDVAIGDAGFTAFEVHVLPIVLAMVLAYVGMLNMPSFLSSYRKTGVLRRLGATPASPLMLLVAQVVVSALLSVVGIALALVAAFVFFDAVAPASVPAVLGACLLVAACMYGIGMIVASLAPTPNSAIAMGVLLFLGLGALGGMFGGRDLLPDALADVSRYLPFGAGADLISATWTGQPVELSMVIPLLVAVVVSVAISVAFFRWE